MQDLTQGSVTRHLLQLSALLAVSVVLQTLYYLVDLYWVGRLGKEAVAAVGLAGNQMLVVLALTQMLGVGTTTLISHAVGRKDHEHARLVFNQSLVFSTLLGTGFALVAWLTRDAYCRWLGADAQTAALGLEYLNWFIPVLWLQFLMVGMGAALRGTGNVRPGVAVQALTVLLNIALAPVLIFGWGTGRPMGVAGAALASLLAVLVGLAALLIYFRHVATYLKFAPSDWRPRTSIWWGMAKVGMPAGAEFALVSVYLVLVYWIIRHLGAAAQAGFGIGGRVMQSMFLPGLAIGFALAPLAGQNFGARLPERVRESFRSASLLSAGLMLALTLLCQVAPAALMRPFSKDPEVIAFGVVYLRIISWNFVISGLIFTSGSIFQALGNTLPSLACSSLRLVLFALPAYMLSLRPGFDIRQIWYLSLGTVAVQGAMNLVLLRREFARKLGGMEPALAVEEAV